MRSSLWAMICAFVLCMTAVRIVSADENGISDEYTASASVTISGEADCAALTDGSEYTYASIAPGESVTVLAEGINSLYVKFHMGAKPWTATHDLGTSDFGNDGFLHEYALLPGVSNSVVMTFPEGADICELRIFGEGEPPKDVQVWQKPYDKADAVLMSSHSDDDQLFFAGLIPYCASADIDLQVVYFCEHNGEPMRLHEQLNGLWAAGATHYPAIGIFPDLYSESLEWAENSYTYAGYENDDFVAYQCEMIRRFKPEVVIGHDVNGEYGHGTHMLNAKTLMQALDLTGDASAYPGSAEMYGVWDVPKTYIHLYGERQIVMDYDTPLEYFGGRTAYQMSVEGFGCHNSQHWMMFTKWLVGDEYEKITAASQIRQYSPCEYGLYRTTVGDDPPDIPGNDAMFENVQLRKDIPEEPVVTEPDKSEEPVVTELDKSEVPVATEPEGSEQTESGNAVPSNTSAEDSVSEYADYTAPADDSGSGGTGRTFDIIFIAFIAAAAVVVIVEAVLTHSKR